LPIDTPATILTSLKAFPFDWQARSAPAAETALFCFTSRRRCSPRERDFSGPPDHLRPSAKGPAPADAGRRLDLNTEGLLLLTNDGEFKRQLELPSTGVERIYRARVFGDVTQEQLEDLIQGVEIEGIRYGSIDANMERRTGRNFLGRDAPQGRQES
jgi:23S rRNA pseudouridine2605 synthase